MGPLWCSGSDTVENVCASRGRDAGVGRVVALPVTVQPTMRESGSDDSAGVRSAASVQDARAGTFRTISTPDSGRAAGDALPELTHDAVAVALGVVSRGP